MSSEYQIQEAQKRIDGYRAAAAAFPTIRKTLESFSGKVYNIKLDRALKEAISDAGHIYVEKKYNHISIEYSPKNCNNWHCLAWLSEADALPDGKRLDAGAMIESAKEKRADLLKEAFELEEAAKHADEIREQLEAWTKTLEKILDPVPREAREIFKLTVRSRLYSY